MSDRSPLFAAHHLQKSFRKIPVINDLSLAIYSSEIVAILGANGAGKTTLFDLCMGILKPNCGKLFFQGKEITSLPLHRRGQLGIGYLAQNPSIFRQMSVAENILALLELQSLSRMQQKTRLEELLDLFELTELATEKAITLSGGEKRRLEIARSLVTRPQLFFLDEPFANVDPLTIEQLKQHLLQLKKQGISIFLTDHNAKEVLSFVDHCYLLHKGTLIASGTREQLIQNSVAKQLYLGEQFSL